MSTLSVGTIKSTATTPPVIQNSSGTAIGTFCRAWVNFNGTGTVAIRASFNVSSITDNGTGDYTVNFTNAMPDANYSVSGSGQFDQTNSNTDGPTFVIRRISGALSTTSARICSSLSGSGFDCTTVCVSIFR